MSGNKPILNETDRQLLRFTAYTFGGIALLSGLYLGGRYIINRAIANRIENMSFEEGTPATYAKRLKMAFQNNGMPGTNVPGIRRTLQNIPTKEMWNKVQKAYQQLYRQNLIAELTHELTNTEYDEMLAIMEQKPDRVVPANWKPSIKDYYAWAKRLHAALNYLILGFWPGTDEDAIRAVFSEIPTQTDYAQVEKAYQQLYASRLADDLASDLEIWEHGDFIDIIKSKPIS